MKTAIKRANNVEQTLADSWQIVSLEMDKSGTELGRYFAKLAKNLKRAHLSDELCDRDGLAKKIGRIVVPERKTLVIYGSGSFHHYTYGLCRAADRLSKGYCYIHFDYHDDYDTDNPQRLGCGSFVNAILQDTHAAQAIFIGTSIPWKQSIHSIGCSGKEETISDLERTLKKNPQDVYLSFDLDVMDPSEISTDYSMGDMGADELVRLIEMIKGKKRIIGADVLGYSRDGYSTARYMYPSYLPTPKKSKQLYARIAKAVLPGGYLKATSKH